jgi:predicted Zn-dependent protease
VLLARAASESSTDDVLEARKAFEEELAVDPTNANAAYELAEMDRKAGEFESARKRFEEAVANYPAFEQALVGLGRTLVALGRPAEALPHLKAALKSNPEDHIAYYQIAQAYRALGNIAEQEKALAEFHRVRSLTERRTAGVPEAKRDVTPQVLDIKPPK